MNAIGEFNHLKPREKRREETNEGRSILGVKKGKVVPVLN
jgi:hypothetical protein